MCTEHSYWQVLKNPVFLYCILSYRVEWCSVLLGKVPVSYLVSCGVECLYYGKNHCKARSMTVLFFKVSTDSQKFNSVTEEILQIPRYPRGTIRM